MIPLNRRRWRNRLTIATVAALSLPGTLSAQNRQTLETKVTASGNAVILKWSEKHPWDAELSAHGASLFAEYRTARGVGVDCVQPAPIADRRRTSGRGYAGSCFSGDPVLRREERTIHFRLPDMLAAEPLGDVCLFLRLPSQRILPVRKANKKDDDTARFQHRDWSRIAVRRTQVANLQQRHRDLQTALSIQSAAVREQEESNLHKGWQSDEACSVLTGGSVEVRRSDRPIALPKDHNRIARIMCVIRLDNGTKRKGVAKPPTLTDSYLKNVNAALRDRWWKVRGQQLEQYRNDWTDLSPAIHAFKRSFPIPHFGDYDEHLYLQSLAVVAELRSISAVEANEIPEPRDVLGYVGASAEAYDRCVRDGKRQLVLNYTEAEALKATLEALPARLHTQAVQECREGVSKLHNMRARLARFEKDLENIETQSSEIVLGRIPSKLRELNAMACMP